MSHLYDWYFQQTVQENELDAAFEALQTAERNMYIDAGIAAVDVDSNYGGIHKGLSVSTPSGLNVDVTAGAAYDHQGRRVALATQQTVDLSMTGTTAIGAGGTPTGGTSTAPGVGNKRWVSLFMVFDRELSDSRVDGLGSPVFFSRAESHRFTVAQGAADPAPVDLAPLETGKLLLGDFRITDGGVIDLIDLDRRQVWVRGADSSVPTTRAGSGYPVRGIQNDTGMRDAVLHLLGVYNDHVNNAAAADKHTAANVDATGYSGTDFSTSATEAQGYMDDISSSYDAHLGGGGVQHADEDVTAALISDSPNSLAAGSVRDQMTELLGYVNAVAVAGYGGGNNWADGTTNPATSYEGQFDKIIDDLTSASGAGGAGKIYKVAASNWADGNTNPAANLSAFIDNMIDDLTSTTGGRGAGKITAAPTSTWENSDAITAGTLHAVLNQIVGDLAETAGTSGAERLGTAGTGSPTPSAGSGFGAGSIHDALVEAADQLAGRAKLSATNTFTLGNTFNGSVAFGSVVDFDGTIGTHLDFTSAGTDGYLRFTDNGSLNSSGVVNAKNIPKAWVNWTGDGATGAQTLNEVWNVGPVSMAAGGNTTVTFGISFADTNYVALGVVEGYRYQVIPITLSTNTCVFAISDVDTGSQIDETTMNAKSCHMFFIGNHYT